MRDGVSASVVSVPNGAAHLLDFLAQRMPGISRSEWAERLAQGLVLHEDGQIALPHQSCQPGQRLYYYRHLADEPVLPFQARILFEDAHLLVADKPHFMPVTPSGRYVQQSLLVQLKRLTGCADLVPLHRIDRETAGLVLLGKRLPDRDAYHALFRDTRSPLRRKAGPCQRCTPAVWCPASPFSERRKWQAPPTARPASGC
jgi:tRNA pseudouridine32 synthase/23S rRNA pseudouridine746 synthase